MAFIVICITCDTAARLLKIEFYLKVSEDTFDSSAFEVVLSHMVIVGIIEEGLGRNTTHVQTSSSQCGVLFYTHRLFM